VKLTRLNAGRSNIGVVSLGSLGALYARMPGLDLLHIDIQGNEADLIIGWLSTHPFCEKVAYALVGTHSRHTPESWLAPENRTAIYR
jgi:hypothetical protein